MSLVLLVGCSRQAARNTLIVGAVSTAGGGAAIGYGACCVEFRAGGDDRIVLYPAGVGLLGLGAILLIAGAIQYGNLNTVNAPLQ